MVSDGRRQRLESSVAREVAAILQTELKMPLPGLVTVTGVEITRDAGEAKIRYTFMGTEAERSDVARRLTQLAPFVQREVSHRLKMRVTPKVRFEFDRQVQKGARVLELLSELEKEHGADSGNPD